MKYGAKYVSLKTDDPYTITLERALEVIREKEIADANRLILDFPDAGIQVLNGRYGPYITDKTRNAKIPKDRDPKSLTLEECQSPAGGGAGAHVSASGAARTAQGRSGRQGERRTGKRPTARPQRPERRQGAAPARPRRRAGNAAAGTTPAAARRQGLESGRQEARAGGDRARAESRAAARPQRPEDETKAWTALGRCHGNAVRDGCGRGPSAT